MVVSDNSNFKNFTNCLHVTVHWKIKFHSLLFVHLVLANQMSSIFWHDVWDPVFYYETFLWKWNTVGLLSTLLYVLHWKLLLCYINRPVKSSWDEYRFISLFRFFISYIYYGLTFGVSLLPGSQSANMTLMGLCMACSCNHYKKVSYFFLPRAITQDWLMLKVSNLVWRYPPIAVSSERKEIFYFIWYSNIWIA